MGVFFIKILVQAKLRKDMFVFQVLRDGLVPGETFPATESTAVRNGGLYQGDSRQSTVLWTTVYRILSILLCCFPGSKFNFITKNKHTKFQKILLTR